MKNEEKEKLHIMLAEFYNFLQENLMMAPGFIQRNVSYFFHNSCTICFFNGFQDPNMVTLMFVLILGSCKSAFYDLL